jgi:hypothetical protein
MTAEMGQLFGYAFWIGFLVAGWRGVPFKWVTLVAAIPFGAGLIFRVSLSLMLAGFLACLFWYGLALGARRLFGGGRGYSMQEPE